MHSALLNEFIKKSPPWQHGFVSYALALQAGKHVCDVSNCSTAERYLSLTALQHTQSIQPHTNDVTHSQTGFNRFFVNRRITKTSGSLSVREFAFCLCMGLSWHIINCTCTGLSKHVARYLSEWIHVRGMSPHYLGDLKLNFVTNNVLANPHLRKIHFSFRCWLKTSNN